MKRVTTVFFTFCSLFSMQSCRAEEKQGEQQTSDVASSINDAVSSEQEPLKEKKAEDFKYNDNRKKDYLVTISTEFGEIKMILFDSTLNHKKNFIKLASEGYYDKMAFHRVINEFMIQGGDPNSKTDNEASYGQGGPGYTIPAEFHPHYIHRKGALAAARRGGPSNPEKESSGSQFYIVEGKIQTRQELEQIRKSKFERAKFEEVKRLLNLPENKSDLDKVIDFQQKGDQKSLDLVVAKYTPEAEKLAEKLYPEYTEEQIKVYETEGGTPMLDMDYTVYGQVVSGLDIVDKITQQPLAGSLPTQKIVITVTAELLRKKKITKETGYEFE